MSDSYEEIYIYGHFTGFIDFLFMSLGFARNGKTRDGRCQDEDGARDYSQIGIIPAGYKTADRSSLSRRDGYYKNKSGRFPGKCPIYSSNILETMKLRHGIFSTNYTFRPGRLAAIINVNINMFCI
jgi:hypothetical protein